MTQATCIGFVQHTSEMPTPADMMQVYRKLEAQLLSLGVNLTYFSADDGTGRGTLRKWNGAFHKKALANGMAGYRSIGLAANPVGSTEPG